MLCVLAVFIPAFFMQGAARNLFVPLALAVGFSMIASYLLSSTLVPVLAIWMLRAKHTDADAAATTVPTRFDRVRERYHRFAGRVVALRWVVVPVYLVLATLVVVIVGRSLGREIFPVVDAGQFQLRLRAAGGSRLEATERIAVKTLDVIAREVGPENVDVTLGYVGVQNAAYPINTIYLWTGGSGEAVLQVQLKSSAKVRVAALQERCEEVLPEEIPGLRISFEPSDIVSRVMSFGALTPIEVAVSGPNLANNRAFAQQVHAEMAKDPEPARPELPAGAGVSRGEVDIDRQTAGMMGVTAEQIGRSLTEATSSSRFTTPNYFADPKSGVGYQVQVEVPQQRMNSLEEVKNIPVARSASPDPAQGQGQGGQAIPLRNVAEVTQGTVLGEYDRYNMQRMLTLGANVSGEDLGTVARRVNEALKRVGAPPQGVNVALRGQVVPMEQMFGGLQSGLLIAIVVVLPPARGELPVLPPLAGGDPDAAGRRRGRRDRAAGHADDAEHPVVHGRDHGDRRGRRERDPARHLRRAQPGSKARASPRRGGRRVEPASAHPHDQPSR
jgi:multidrug efflux pump subunit AcrB